MMESKCLQEILVPTGHRIFDGPCIDRSDISIVLVWSSRRVSPILVKFVAAGPIPGTRPTIWYSSYADMQMCDSNSCQLYYRVCMSDTLRLV